MGIPVYGEDIRNAILARLEAGELLCDILSTPGMPGRQIVSEWAREGPWADLYARARRMGVDAQVERSIHVSADQARDPQCRKVEADAIRWVASRMAPDKYGDRTAVQMLDEHGKPAKAGITIIVDGAPGE